MDTRLATLLRIREQLAREGLSAALRTARSAYEAGHIDARDVPEVFMALKSGSWRFLDQLGLPTDASGGFRSRPAG